MNCLKVNFDNMVATLSDRMIKYKEYHHSRDEAVCYTDEITTVVEFATETAIENICALSDSEILAEYLNFMMQFPYRSHEQLTSRVYNMTNAIQRFHEGEEEALREALSSNLAFWLELEYRNQGLENIPV